MSLQNTQANMSTVAKNEKDAALIVAEEMVTMETEATINHDVPNTKQDGNDGHQGDGASPIKDEKDDTVPVGCDDDDGEEDDDPYSYTKRNLFTSEIYKIEVTNLPKHYGFKQLKKMFTNQLNLKPNKIKIFNRATYCFVTFRCEEDRDSAIKAVNGFTWRKNKLGAKKANPAQDPHIRSAQKRKLDVEATDSKNKIVKKTNEESMLLDDSIPVHEKLNNVATPLWKLDYKDQLVVKEKEMSEVLKFIAKRIEKQCPNMLGYIKRQKRLYNHQCCKLDSIKPSPVTEAYRNKSEFSIGVSPDGQEKTVGFKMGSYRGGFDTVVEPSKCCHIPQSMKTAAKAVQSYIQQSDRLGYNNRNHDGFWKLVTMRTSLRNQTMVLVTVNTEGLSEEEIEKEKKSLLAYYEDGAGKDDKPSSLLIQAQENKIGVSGVYDIDSPSEALFGDPYITEDILGIKFRISAEAFFQVNSIAAGILYTAIKEISGVSENTTVLDICCGTGTIGISLAKNVKRVIGVEMCKQAVKDAEHNAKENGITNIKFLCGKAEDVLHKAIYDVYGSKEVVGILDPPRAGLHAKVIRAIRGCQYINKLVYVSCSPRSAESNFVDLCRQTSKRIKGEAFRPTCAIPVDLFPHTKHCELIVLFERDSVTISHNDSKPNEETIVPEQNTSHDSGEHDIDGVSKTEHDSDKIPDKQCTSDIVMNTEESTSHGSGEPLDTQGTSNIDGVSHSEQSTSHGSGEPLDTQGTSNIDEVSHSEQSSNSGEPLNKQSTSDIDEKAPCTKSMCIEPSDGLASTISQHSCIESGGSVEKDVETEMPSANVETKEAAVCSDNGVSKMDLDKQNV